MKPLTIVAYQGKGDNKVKAGEITIKDFPEDFSELCDSNIATDEEVYKGWKKSYVIARQAGIRPGTGLTDLEKAFRALTPEQQMAVLARK